MSTRGPTILNHTKSGRWQGKPFLNNKKNNKISRCVPLGKPKNKYVRKTNIDISQVEKIMLSTTFSLYPRVEILKNE